MLTAPPTFRANIVIAAEGALVTELTHCGEGVTTVLSAADGVRLQDAIKSGGIQSGAKASFFSKRAPGAFLAIDSAGKLQELGWQKYSTLEMLSWSAQYLGLRPASASSPAPPAADRLSLHHQTT